MRQYTVNDFFCGAGGIALGFINAGFTVKWACDFDKNCVKTYAHNVGEWVQQLDVTQITYKDVPKADGWAFGFPCQDLSVAGKQAGFQFRCLDCGTEWKHEHEGLSPICPKCGATNYTAITRSACFFEIMRLLDETERNAPENYPSFLLAENVKGLRPYIPVLTDQLEQRGFDVHIQLYNSKYWKVPQNRERYFIVATPKGKGSFSFPEEQHEYVPKLSSALDKEVAEKYYISDEKARAIILQALKKIEKLGGTHPCITPGRIEKRQNGRRAKEDEAESFTLTAQDIHGVILYTGTADKQAEMSTHFSEAVRSGLGAKQRNQKGVFVGVSPKLTATDDRGPHLIIENKDDDKQCIKVVGMLENSGTTQQHNNRVHSVDGISPTLTAVSGGTHHIKIFDVSKYRVRKLTPTEYGRLQAFPVDDGWEQVVSDSQAYHQFGNAVTVSVVAAIGGAIRNYLDDIFGA